MIKKSLIIFFLIQVFTFSQFIYEPVYKNGIYNFLDEQSLKGKIQIFDEIRPYTRLYIAENLIKLSEQCSSLSTTEKELLDFYKREYAFEIKYIEKDTTEVKEFFMSGQTGRFKLFKYYDKDFTFDTDPILGFSYDFTKKNYHQYSGVKLKGRINDFVGYYFDYRDNLEMGNNLDIKKFFSPVTGVVISKSSTRKIEYSETRGGITFGWRWGALTMAKDFINIGSSYQSQVILSSKAPSFSYFRLDIHPVNWFRFNFIHAWVNSVLVDSNSIRYTGVNSTLENRSKTYSRRQKFYVSHSISLMPTDNLWISLGESIIYSDQLEYIYFLPVFYRLADHYNSLSSGDTGDNAQIFLNTSFKWNKVKSKFYLSLYIDELSLERFFTGGNNAQVFAITLGSKIANPFLQNGYLTLEYTAIKPYNYMNGDPAQTYFSSGYQLGHWIGSNSLQLYLLYEQYLSQSLKLEFIYQLVKKGSKENIMDYYNRITSTYPLLFGNVNIYSQAGLKISYNPFNDLFFKIEYSNILISEGRFINEYGIYEGTSFITSMNYGF